ncbi:MAG: transposase [Candidatus Hodarchaeota archaeon]
MTVPETVYQKDSMYFFESSMTNCSYCDSPLFISYHSGVKTVKTFNGIIKAKHVVKECTNKKCKSKLKRKEKYFYAEQFQILSLPGCNIGLDITLAIGYQMHICNHSLGEVHKYLLNKQIEIDESTVYRHYQKYLDLMSELSDQDIGKLRKDIKRNAGYILSIDAVYSENSPLLLVCRDTLTKKVLKTKLIKSENDKDITPLLVEVKENFGDPMAIVSDMGHGIKKSIENIFPSTKHQYCHFHFLKNLGIDLLDEQYQIIKTETNNFKKK